jgi:hypothetical protein
MSSKIFVVLAMVLVMSSLSVAALPPGYGYLPPGDGGETTKPLEIELDPSCEENVVTIYRKNTPETVSGAHVTVTDVAGGTVFSGDTDVDGQVTFEGCGMTVRIYASKSGWKADEQVFDLIPCEQCEEEEEEGPVCGDGVCEEGETTENCPEDCPSAAAPPGAGEEGAPPEFECTSNADCEDAEYCAMAVGAAGGACEPVTGECGYAENHVWVQYECGDEAGCPTCDAGFECIDHTCVPAEEEEEPPPVAAPEEPEEGEEPEEEEGFPWLFFLGGLLFLGLIAWWFLTQAGKGRR